MFFLLNIESLFVFHIEQFNSQDDLQQLFAEIKIKFCYTFEQKYCREIIVKTIADKQM